MNGERLQHSDDSFDEQIEEAKIPYQ